MPRITHVFCTLRKTAAEVSKRNGSDRTSLHRYHRQACQSPQTVALQANPHDKDDRFSDLLAKGKIILADGATGTNYFALGLTSGEPPEFWLDSYPERVAV